MLSSLHDLIDLFLYHPYFNPHVTGGKTDTMVLIREEQGVNLGSLTVKPI